MSVSQTNENMQQQESLEHDNEIASSKMVIESELPDSHIEVEGREKQNDSQIGNEDNSNEIEHETIGEAGEESNLNLEQIQQLQSTPINLVSQNEEDEEDSWDDRELMPQALPIANESDLDSEASDYEGLQYLLNVRKQAQKPNSIMVAKNAALLRQQETDEKYIPHVMLKGHFSDGDSSLSAWELDQIAQFKNFKRHLDYVEEEVRKGASVESLISNYYGSLSDDKYVKSKKCFMANFLNEDASKVVVPTTQTLLKITYIRLEKILEYIDENVHERLEAIAAATVNARSTATSSSSNEGDLMNNSNNNSNSTNEKAASHFFNYYQFQWIYGLFGRLNHPILADVSSILNNILKLAVVQQKHANPTDPNAQMNAAMTSLIILIIREYYGQKYTLI